MGFLRCNCHTKQCHVCKQCPKHDCAHDGISIEEKQKKKRGRQPGPLVRNGLGKRKRIKNTLYPEAASFTDMLQTVSSCVKACSSVTDVSQALNVGHVYMHNFPSVATRSEQESLEKIDRHQTMVHFAVDAFEKICEIVYPVNSHALRNAVFREYGLLIGKQEELQIQMIQHAARFKRRSIERRTLYAALSGTLTQAKLSALSKKVTDGAITIKPCTYASIRRDFTLLENGIELERDTKNSCKYSTAVVEKAVRFILSPQNTQILAWGERQITVGLKKVSLPKITRKRIPKYIYDGYLEHVQNDSESLKRTKMYEIIGAITANDMKAATAVDYATGVLVNDNCDRLEKILETINDHEMQFEMQKKLKTLCTIVKYHLDKAVFEPNSNEFDTHCLRFALKDIASSTGNLRSCATCQRVFEIMEEFQRCLPADTHSYLLDSKQKFRLYMGHRYVYT